MNAEAQRAPATVPRERFARLRGLGRLAVAVLLALHPLGAVLVLGWLMRLMRDHEAVCRAAPDLRGRVPLPRWLGLGRAPGRSVWAAWLGGVWQSVRLGLAALATLAAGTLPFTGLWLLAWWGGWENSFNKGYEQSWVGPTVSLLAVAIALPLLARLPMALAHQAAEERTSAFFARRAVGRLIRAAGWRYVLLMALSAVAALPLTLLQVAPVFVEGWSPGFLDRSPEEVEAFVSGYRLVATAYLVVCVIRLRRMAARLHARAALALEARPREGRVGVGTVLRTALMWSAAFALVAQIYVAQFFNHQWAGWLFPPTMTLPWFPPLSGAL